MNSRLKAALIHSSLFVLTFITATLAGSEWVYSKSIYSPDFTADDFIRGMSYSVPLLLILTVHEFGHYFTAAYHKIKASLPYYIPLPPPFILGTLGAIIRIRSVVKSMKQNFDIGVSGPVAGFVVALIVLYYGFSTLPPPEHIFEFHPEYEKFGLNYADHVYEPEVERPEGSLDVTIGTNLVFLFFERFVAEPGRVPNAHEMMHYPVLLAGLFALMFTSLNLLPFGQLDGGHVLYGLLGFRKHRLIASIIFCLFTLYACLGFLVPGEELEFGSIKLWHPVSVLVVIALLYFCLGGLRLDWKTTLMLAVIIFAVQYFVVMAFPDVKGYHPWFVFALIVSRFISVPHPPSEIEEPLGFWRKVLGWIALLMFVVCLTPNPLNVSAP